MRKILIYVVLLVAVVVGIGFFIIKNKNKDVVVAPEEPIKMCYQYSKQTPRGYDDRAWLKMSILGDNVTGEYRNLPAETDSKVGEFTGTVGPMDPKISGRIANVWWDSFAEGMRVTEQLNIEFGEGSAVALFGEMVDRGDGVYVYKDTTKLSPGFQMSQVDCEVLDDKIIVEKYIRENIKEIISEEPVLGGSWYATIIDVNPLTKTAEVEYEDGHIQGKATFEYVRNGSQVTVKLAPGQ